MCFSCALLAVLPLLQDDEEELEIEINNLDGHTLAQLNLFCQKSVDDKNHAAAGGAAAADVKKEGGAAANKKK